MAVVFIICCALMDLLPRYGAPEFRYWGSDPEHHVWNLGWPIALAIYDSRSGIHLGPISSVVILFQAVVIFLIGIAWVFRSWRNRSLQTSSATQPRS